MPDDFSPMFAGDTLVPLSVQFQHADGTAFNLTAITLSLVMESVVGSVVTRRVGTGAWTTDNATAGQAHYDWSAADVAVAGTWSWQVDLMSDINGKTEHGDIRTLQIDPPL